jgi:histone arginine demethylase JMJD6
VSVQPVDVRDGSVTARELLVEYMLPAKPVVLRHAARAWRAISRWTPRFLAESYGAVEVTFQSTEGQAVRRPLREYFDLRPEEQADWYVVDWAFASAQPELLADIELPDHFSVDWMRYVPAARRPKMLWIYIGHAGTGGRTHVDNHGSSAWLAVVDGEKRVRFARRAGHSEVRVSTIDLFDSEIPAWLEVSEASLQPGDILFVPAAWWHAATNDTYCLSVTANFVNGSNFISHMFASTRDWYGDQMLEGEMEAIENLPLGTERDLRKAHLEFALAKYESLLMKRLGELRAASLALTTGTGSPGTTVSEQ